MGIRNQLLTAGALMAGFAVSGGAQADTWLKDAISDCAVWSDQPLAQEIVSWSGACADDKASGDGVLVVVKDGRLYVRYSGPMTAGRAYGVGKVEYHTEAGYVTYWGQFEGSMLKGQGFLRRPDGGIYSGGFDNDEPEGRGTYTAADGAYYQGEFSGGKPHGMGFDRTAAGEHYAGQYRDGRRHGSGRVTFADGASYEGSFDSGEPDGAGRWEGPDGDVYEGEFRLGQAAGKGKYTAPDGEVHEGMFVANLPDGEMVVTKADGTQAREMWKDGKEVK